MSVVMLGKAKDVVNFVIFPLSSQHVHRICGC